MKATLWALLLLVATTIPAVALNPSEVLADPALEARARAISHQLRCLVCQNQSIDESDADLAGDLRVLVRERLVAGDTDGQVLDFVVARYGEFVLLNPVFAWHTLALWLAAPALLIIGSVAVLIAQRRRQSLAPAGPMTDEEEAALATLADDGAGVPTNERPQRRSRR